MIEREMGKTYEPHSFEDDIYKAWEDSDAFKPNPKSDKKRFSVVLPPPNITGQLHMGHALDHSIQDVMCRFKRLQDYDVLWLPGTDHASIATEVKVWDALREEGVDTDKVNREDFLKRAWQWKDEYEGRIIGQMKKLGSSTDWSRLRFTMDEGCNKAVTSYFVKMYRDGLIYRGERMINWCVDCGTSLSDQEVEHEDKDGAFYHVKYMLEDGSDYLTIATTRPETILGDTAVAINPADERFKGFAGKNVIVPIVDRLVPIIEDEYVDLETGTGALKVTPSHDVNDFAIGERHDLESICVIDLDGKMSNETGKYAGMTREQCRKEIVKDLDEMNLLLKVVPHNHSVGCCYRCHKEIEPMVSEQWFANMDSAAKRGLEGLNKDLFFVPKRFDKVYTMWLEGIRDWCISRQLWWGHRIPAYYCDDCGHVMVDYEMPHSCENCGSKNLRQDEDVLDTWFSSALWPFSTMGWPDDAEDLQKYYPTSVLVTGYDIIFFWVARMVFAGLYNTDKMPFDEVVIHGLVRDHLGRKMSKSLGNGVNPLEVIEKYGADALRFMLITGNIPGNDQRYQVERVEAARNFANKLWNAARFVLMGVEDIAGDINSIGDLEIADEWILARLGEVSERVFEAADKHDYAYGGSMLYEFVWNEYCDWYIEIAKIRLYGDDVAAKKNVEKVLIFVLKKILMLLQPYMPFITQEIYSYMEDAMLMNEVWEDLPDFSGYEESKQKMQAIMEAVKSIRNARQEMDIAPSKKAKLFVYSGIGNVFLDNSSYFVQLASVSQIDLLAEDSAPDGDMIVAITKDGKFYIPADDLIDYKKEADRLGKECQKLNSEIQRIEAKLSNQGFVGKAPETVVEGERKKLREYQSMLQDAKKGLEKVESKLQA